MNPIKFSLRYPVVTLFFTAVFVIVGLYAFFTMPRAEDPTITIRIALVLAQYPGATSEQVEKQVTKVLERHILQFPEVKRSKTYSTSRPGFVFINVYLEDYVKNADLFWARLRHEMNEARAELPPGVRGPIVNSSFGDTVALLLAVHGERYSYRELREYTERIQDALRGVRDVGKMERYGEQGEEILVTTSFDRLAQYRLDPARVMQALQQRNVIGGSGNLDTELARIPLRTTGLLSAEDQVGDILVDVSQTGQAVHMRDFSKVERRYQDPVFLVRYDGKPSVLLSVEMQRGRNMAKLGDEVAVVMKRVESLLPPDVKIDFIANQPAIVKARISSLSREFLLAIGSVLLVTMILLPLRVSMIAALAIPVSLCSTLGIMNAVGIDLQQCSIGALIVVLGILVDDAIVITDNYLDLLDHGVDLNEACWRSATDVIVPVLTATITIICSFMPQLLIRGSAGEFLQSVPLTASIALIVSFIVAVMLTPLLCRFFIRKGLHDKTSAAKSTTVLDRLQDLYLVTIVFFMKRKTLALMVGLASILLGAVLFRVIPQQFFPSAERNQFVIDVWNRQGSRIEATDALMKRIEKHLATVQGVKHYSSFVGQSAPRFFYNVNPQQPDGAYGQMIVNTESADMTPLIVSRLSSELARQVPEALVIVKELQQGDLLEAPVEVRISGDDFGELKRLAAEVQGILSAVPFSRYVHPDCFNDSYLVDVNVEHEMAGRLGLTSGSIAQILSGGFDGAPVSTFWEGDRAVTLFFRIDQAARTSFADVGNTYIASPLTQSSVPLRSFSHLSPEWQMSRIVHRSGIRTLTVRSFVAHGYYASELLKTIEPKIRALPLPPGYEIRFGGESDNQAENLPQMSAALGVSVLAIFLVMLIQFRSIAEPLMVMSSIPLMFLGSVVGLLVTRNVFGFMAFMGFVSLTGIVVRNGIILIDFIKSYIAQGYSVEEAATQAGRRRLRPIFLTTMAAAVGVTPMIVSGSSLWSPIASVIAVGLIFSMFFTLLVVPVLYVMVHSKPSGKAASTMLGLLIASTVVSGPAPLGIAPAQAETRQITLEQAIDLALANSRTLKIAQARVQENREKITEKRSDYFPHLSNSTSYSNLTNNQLVTIPAGALGTVPYLGAFPTQDVHLEQGSDAILVSTTTIAQPLTQLLKVRQADRIAQADEGMAEADLSKVRAETVYAVRQLYYGLVISGRQKAAAEAAIAAAEENLRESRNAVESGNVLDVAVTGVRVALLQGRQADLTARIHLSDLSSELNDLLGFPLDTVLFPADAASDRIPAKMREEYLRESLSHNPDLEAARRTVEKSESGVRAAAYDYIPDIGIFGRYVYQDGVPFVDRNIGMVGVQLSWDIFDWGKRRSVLEQRRQQRYQAQENLKRLQNRVAIDVDKAWRRLEQSRQLVEVAHEALELEKERVRLSTNGLKAGTVTTAKHAEAVAALKKAECDEIQALAGVELAVGDLERLAGKTTVQ